MNYLRAVPSRRFRWHKSWVTSVAVAPDGMTAATGGEDGTVVAWDLADGG